jgi:HK97 family phage major capsid protein
MSTKLMTMDALTDHIAKFVNDNVANLVKASIEAQLAPLAQRQTDWMERMLENGNGHRRAEPTTAAERSLRFGRIVRAGAAAAMALRGGQVIPVEDILKRWGDKDLAMEIGETRQKAMAAGDASAGGFLVPPTYSQDVIEFLRGQSVVRRLGARSIPVPTGTLKMPKLTTGSTAFYVGENSNAVISQLATGLLSLSFKKLVTMVPVSNDLIRYSSPGADAIVRDDTVNGMRVREDQAFIRDDGTAGTPRGLRFWAHADNIMEQTASASIQNTFTDLGRMVQKLLEANMPMLAPAWLMAPRTEIFLRTLLTTTGIPVFRDEMAGGRLWGFPFGSTTNIPTNLATVVAGVGKSELYLVDMAQVLLGESLTLQIDASQEAAYFDGSTVQAAFSLDQTVVRAIAEHDLGVRHDKAIAVMTQMTWAPGSV